MRLGIPTPARASLPRARLVDTVARRWELKLVAVVAGPGFGKTTAVLDGVSADLETAGRRDLWLTCEPGDTNAPSVARAIGDALGTTVASSDDPVVLARHLADTMWSAAPDQLCLVFDDLQELGRDTGASTLVAQLLAVMPTNAHMVCTARVMPNVGAVRMVTQGTGVVLREDQLRFTPEEITEFALLRGVDASLLTASEGWPALAELSATATGVGGVEFIWEQILAELDPERRRRLLELVVLREADDALLSAVAGHDVAGTRIVEDLPMVMHNGDRVRLHSVWFDALATDVPAHELDAIRRKGGAHLLAKGDFDGAIRLLAEAQDWVGVLAALRACLIDRFPPIDFSMLVDWSELLPPDLVGEPEVQLVRGIAASTLDTHEAFARVERAVEGFRARGDIDGELAATGRLGRIANNIGEPARVAPYLGRLGELAAAGVTQAQDFLALAQALMLTIEGKPVEVLTVLQPLIDMPGRDPLGGAAHWFYGRALGALGRNHELSNLLADLSFSIRESAREAFETLEIQAALALGRVDIAEALLEQVDRRSPVGQTAYNVHFGRLNCATAFALLGRADDARRMLGEVTDMAGERSMTEARLVRNVQLLKALLSLLDGDEARARELLPEFVPGIGYAALDTTWYVLCPEARDQLDQAGTGEEVRWRYQLTRAFTTARESGDLEPMRAVPWISEGMLRTTLIAPWLVEAAVFARAAGNPMPEAWYEPRLARYPAVVRALTASSHSAVAAAATAMSPLATADTRLRLCVFGPMRLTSGDHELDARELRRERVRALLARLIGGRQDRNELAEALWPDLSPEKATANLRVTLSYALRVFEPDRQANVASPYLAAEGTSLRLTNAVTVDATEFDAWAEAGRRADAAGDIARALDFYADACDLYRGDYLAGCALDETMELERIRYRTTFVRVGTRAAELLLAKASCDTALALAQRVLACDPWNEAAYCVAAAALLDSGSHVAAREVLAAGRTSLAEIGVDEPTGFASLEQRIGRTVGATP